ncbi:YchJ family protein [Vibrio chagasii]|uniref:YchJ family protein n=1 Tax=Vibrio chagasii TaxID=170679 RepID=A0A7Y3YQB7_9VIBR|nr:YchJ family protein [Vibrio chagasii]NOH34560.1 YchJ family protein [Vibrio chagasii]
MSLCPCGSNNTYPQCCESAHLDHSSVETPEQLMRSRYSAHVLGLVDYVVATYHPSCNAEAQREGIADSINSDWAGLEVIDTAAGSHENEGYVEFKAYFNEDGAQYCMQERSRFVRENGLWFYIDGEFPEQSQPEPEIDPRLNQTVESFKIGRNDPCICGSGKKYKKCCG